MKSMPGFTAEASLYKSSGYYLGKRLSNTIPTIIPQLLFSDISRLSLFNLYGGCFRNCISRCNAGDFSRTCVSSCDFICSMNPIVVFLG